MRTESRAPRLGGGAASTRRAVLAGAILIALLAGFGGIARADPDFSNVSDILGGQRYLLRDDDLVVGQLARFQRSVLKTRGLEISNAATAPVTSATCGGSVPTPPPFQTRVGRVFGLDHDVVVSVAPLPTAGAQCGGVAPNLAIYVQDPLNPANDSQTGIAISPFDVQIVLADFNADGYADLLLLNDQFAIVYTAVDPHRPALGMVEVAQLATGSMLAPGDTPVAGDFNGDGALEVAWPSVVQATLGLPAIWQINVASVCPAAGAVVLGQRCGRAFQIVLGTQLITIGSLESGWVPTIALAAGQYDGVLNPVTGLPVSRLVIAYNAITDAGHDVVTVYSFDAALSPTRRSELRIPYGPNTLGGYFDRVLLASGRLRWFESTDQVVFSATQAGIVSVITFDANLAMTSHAIPYPNANRDPSAFDNNTVGLAVGRFDPSSSDPNLQIARLGQQYRCCPPSQGQVLLEIYTVDAAFTPALASSFVLANELLFTLFQLDPSGQPSPLMVDQFGNPLAAGDLQARSQALGPPQKLTVTGSMQPEVVLGLPPMHIDFVRDANSVPNGVPAVLNVSARPSKFFSQYQTQQSASNQSSNTSTTSYTFASKDTAAAGFSFGIPGTASVGAEIKATTQQAYNNTVATKYNTYASRQFDVSTQTGFSDLVWFTGKRFNVYAYRVLGQCVAAPGSAAAEGCPAGTQPLYVQFSGPDIVRQSRIDGNLLEWYQPVQEPGNVFSYPWNRAQLQALYAGFGPLTADPATIWSTDSSGSAVSVTWTEGSGSSVTSGSVATQSFDLSTTVSASASAFGVGGSTSVGFDYNSSQSFTTLNESSSALGSSTGIKIVKPPFTNPGQYAYAAQTYIFGQQAPAGTQQQIPLGTMVKSAGPLWTAFLADPTDIGGGAGIWWAQAYDKPDVALNHPLRWTWTPPTPTKGDVLTFNAANPHDPLDSEFYFMKGLYITPASANGQGSQIVQATAGETIRLSARVYNYSLVDMPPGSAVRVRFYGQEWNSQTHDFSGPAFVISDVQLDPIPGFNSTSSGGEEPNWSLAGTTFDTAGRDDTYIVFWVAVWMEQDGALVPEMTGHGLTEIPGTDTQPTAIAIEPYSNNLGLYNQPFFICANPCPSSASPSGLTGEPGLTVKKVAIAPSRPRVLDKAMVDATLAAGPRSAQGVIVIFYDGDPDRGGEAFDAELVPHIRAGDTYLARVPYRPRACGTRTITVVADGSARGTATVRVECPPASLDQFSGKAERVGSGADNGTVRFTAKLASAPALDLRFATLTLGRVLQDEAGREWVRTAKGSPLLPLMLAPRRGSKATAATFETPGGARPSVQIEVKQRDPNTGELELSLKIERAAIVPGPGGCDPRGGNTVRLRTSLMIADNRQESVDVGADLVWRCGKGEVRTP